MPEAIQSKIRRRPGCFPKQNQRPLLPAFSEQWSVPGRSVRFFGSAPDLHGRMGQIASAERHRQSSPLCLVCKGGIGQQQARSISESRRLQEYSAPHLI
ncbi:hypothetical protein D3C73_1202750 [compost metagenome]